MEHVLKHGVRSAHSASCAQGKKHPELLSTRDPSFTNDITLIQSWAENRSQKRRGTVGRLHDNAHAQPANLEETRFDGDWAQPAAVRGFSLEDPRFSNMEAQVQALGIPGGDRSLFACQRD